MERTMNLSSSLSLVWTGRRSSWSLVAAVVVVLALLASLLTAPHAGADPAPPDGTIAFVSDRSGEDEIYVMDVDGSRVTRLTVNDGFDRAPAWSPDGTQLVFNSRRAPHEDRPQIYRIAVDAPGSELRVTTSDTEDLRASWYPDGSAIVFQRGGLFDGPDLVRHNLDTGEETLLTETDAIDAGAAVAPNGGLVAFQTNRDVEEGFFPFRLALLALASGEVASIPVSEDERDGSDDGPAWSPDGSQLAFARSGSLRLFDLASGETTTLTDGEEFDISPDWSPDGQWLVFQSDRVDEDGGIHLLHLETGEISYLGEGRTPVWTATVRDQTDPTPAPPVTGFSDVTAGSTHAEAIDAVVAAGIMRGTSATTFDPRGPARRDQVATVLTVAFELPPSNEQLPFADVTPGNVHRDGIAAALAAGVTVGTSPTTFGPDTEVTRQQVASMLAGALEVELNTDAVVGFDDVSATNVHAPAIAALVDAGIIRGTTATTFAPRDPVTRGQLASLLARALGLLDADAPTQPLLIDGFTVADGPVTLDADSVGEVDVNGQPGVQRPVVDAAILGGERDTQLCIGSSDDPDGTWTVEVDPDTGMSWRTDDGVHVNMVLEWDGAGDGTTFGPAVPTDPIELDLRGYRGVEVRFTQTTHDLQVWVELGRRGDDSTCGEACGFIAGLSRSEIITVPGAEDGPTSVLVPFATFDAPFAPTLPGTELDAVGAIILHVRSAPQVTGNDLTIREVVLVP